jgi:lipoprotein-anchoring transpeptidase ErfK/SrfK
MGVLVSTPVAMVGVWGGLVPGAHAAPNPTRGAEARSTTAASGASAGVRGTQQLAVLLTVHRAFRAPRTSAPIVARVGARRPITDERTTLPVIGRAKGRGGDGWIEVMLPGRPNGHTGWIARQRTRATQTNWHILIDISRRRVHVYRHGRLVRAFEAVVGKPSTPTPAGNYFVEETVKMPTTEAGGPYALALSARSNVLQEFAGGPGQIAIHGRDNLGGTLGQAVSHGCIRLATPAITWLAQRITPGTPVTITPSQNQRKHPRTRARQPRLASQTRPEHAPRTRNAMPERPPTAGIAYRVLWAPLRRSFLTGHNTPGPA